MIDLCSQSAGVQLRLCQDTTLESPLLTEKQLHQGKKLYAAVGFKEKSLKKKKCVRPTQQSIPPIPEDKQIPGELDSSAETETALENDATLKKFSVQHEASTPPDNSEDKNIFEFLVTDIDKLNRNTRNINILVEICVEKLVMRIGKCFGTFFTQERDAVICNRLTNRIWAKTKDEFAKIPLEKFTNLDR